MFQLTDRIKKKIKQYSLSNKEVENCGLLLNNGKSILIIKLKNESKNPTEHFLISPKSIKKVQKKSQIIGFWHSHPDGEFNEIDKAVSEKTGLISIIYDIPNDSFIQYEPQGLEIPFENRPFLLGVLDCYELVKDFYSRNLNILLPDLKHEARYVNENWAESKYLQKYNNEYYGGLRDFFLNNGFREVSGEPIKYDILLLKLPTLKTPIHCAIYLGDNNVLHHMPYELSKKEFYSSVLKKRTCNILRHKLY